MFFAHGEHLLSIILAMVMGKPHDDIFGHICIYRRSKTYADSDNSDAEQDEDQPPPVGTCTS
jgi:hypothetical protein